MKRLAVIFILILGSLGICYAQGYKDAIAKDPFKAAGTYYVYDSADVPALTPAPAGYEPFYISHFGRHGARWCSGGEYDSLYGWLLKAEDAEVLSDSGKEFFSRYKLFYNKARYCKSNLTGVGKEQHRSIARHMYERFPAVFAGATHVEAASTESARVIMSMWSCLSTLQALDGDIDFNADASGKHASWLQPALSSNPYMIKGAYSPCEAALEAYREYFCNTVPWQAIAKKFFISPNVLGSVLETTPDIFIETLHGVVTGTRCLDEDRGCFDDVFSPEELFLVWKGLSAGYFLDVARFEGSGNRILDYAAFTLGQIIESADADIQSGKTQLRLRFGHDSGIAPLLVLLDADGCGRATSSFEESLEIFPSYNLPMGASLQLVFYRNADGDILLKALVNEREADLPLDAVSGPYYRWTDFKDHYLSSVRASKRKVEWTKPLEVLMKTDWGWRSVGDSKVEVGGASVKVFGSVQDISLARFPMSEHSVSIVESDGPKAAITSKFGDDNKAIAAINGSYFNTKTLMPVTFVKDEGRVLCSDTSDGGTRSNGMFRIQDRKGRKVDILTVGRDNALKESKGWREAIVSGPVLIEEGDAPYYESDGTRAYRKFYPQRHPRTILGYTADGWMYFIVVDGRFPSRADGMSIDELQVLCASLGLYEAINLDGGGSSALWAKDIGVLNHPCDNKVFDHAGERTVPNAIIVK